MDESKFILGIDLGNKTSALSYFDANRNTTEIADLSGGYGKPSVPTVVQYVPENEEWIFGEYAILNSTTMGEDGVMLTDLIDRLGKWETLELKNKSISVVSVLGLFVAELLAGVKSLNPKATIAGIVVSYPGYLGKVAKEELAKVFACAGVLDKVLAFVPDKEALIYYHCFNKGLFSDTFYKENFNERILLLDYADRELRGAIYEMTYKTNGLFIRSLAAKTDKSGSRLLENHVHNLFKECLEQELPNNDDEQTEFALNVFTHQHKDLLFQKLTKPLKLYFNFVYPPFQKAIPLDVINNLTAHHSKNIKEFISALSEKSLYDKKAVSGIDSVILSGGGFENSWARQAVSSMYEVVLVAKNTKCVVSEGCAVMAAHMLGVLPKRDIAIEDMHKLLVDIGIVVKGKGFVPIIERDSFWWQDEVKRNIIINESTENPVNISIYKRHLNALPELLKEITIEGLPVRPKGATRLSMGLCFKSYNEIEVSLSDTGFGEMFPRTDYNKRFCVTFG